MPMDPRHPGPHLTREAARLLAKLTRHGIDPARLSRQERAEEAGPPPSTTELQAALAELDRLLESNPSPGSAEMARLEELAGLVATHADVLPPDDGPASPGEGR